jgi:hypothetical protein
MPFLLVQDTYRYLLIAGDRTKAAVANDAIWLGLQSAIVAALLVSGRPGVTGLTVAFGGAAAVASAAGWLQTRIRPMVRAAPDWLHRFRDLGLPFLYELIMINGIMQITVLAIGLFGDVVTVGQLRAGTLVFAPLTVMFAGVFLIGLPEAVKLGETPARVLRLVVTIGVVTSLATCAWAVLIALVPARLGVDALGANWAPARDLVVPIGVLTTAAAWMLAIAVGLRAVGASRQSLRLRSVGAPIILVLGTVGAVLDGSSGAAAGLAIGACVSAMLAWITFRRAIGTTAP